MAITGYVLSHTHWDREWYLSFQNVRMRLVRLLDRLIPHLEQHPEFPHFHLDGQTVCLEDYLEVRPEMKDRLAALVRDGRLAIGPWYVLPDVMCIGQESVLRNLQRGSAIARSYGRSTPVGYLPDIFSHTSQLPQIFSQLGFRAAVVWRGVSSETPMPYELCWRSHDGTNLLTLHLPDDRGYLNAFPLEDTPEAVAGQFESWFAQRLPYSPSGKLLLMNGCDHQEPNYKLPEFIEFFNQTHTDYQLKQVSLCEYLDELNLDLDKLQTVEGELSTTNLLDGRNLNPTLKQTLSSRIPQKLENYQAEALLVRYAEPLSALLTAAGLPQEQHLLDLAWKYLLQNQPHDSICGCSCDDVHRDMERRFAWTREIGQQYVSEAMRNLGALVDTSRVPDAIPMHLFCLRPAEAQNQVHTVTLRLPADQFFRDVQVTDRNGTVLPSQILNVRQDGVILHPFGRDPWWRDYQLVELAVQVPQVPAMGLTTIFCRPTLVPNTLPTQNSARLHTLENDFLRVNIQPNGTLDVLDKIHNTTYEGLHVWTDEADIGDEYIFSPDRIQSVWNSLTQAPSLHIIEGPLVSRAILKWTYRLADAAEDNVIETTIALTRSSPLLQFHTKISNRAKDHRIRVHFPTGFRCKSSFADSHFDIVEHPTALHQPGPDAWVETESGCFSQKRFCYLQEGSQRLAFLSKGLLEYEVVQGDNGQDLTVTCLRCTDRCGMDRSMTAFAPPGPNALYTKDSQLLGDWEMSYALLLSDVRETLELQAEEYHGPCTFYQDEAHPAAEGRTLASSLLQLDDPDFVVSSIRAVGAGRFLFRGCNLTDCARTVTAHVPGILAAYASDLTEQPGEKMEIVSSSFTFRADPWKIITFLVEI